MTPRARKMILSAAWTALTLAGSIVLEFYLIIDVLGIPAMNGPVVKQVLTSLLAFPVPFAGGALWGAGLAVLSGKRVWPLAKRGMVSWGWTIVIAGVLIDLMQIPVFAFVPGLRFIPHATHWLFTLVFVPSVGLIVSLNVRRILEVQGLEDVKTPGRWSGIAAGAAFLAASILVLVVLDWEIAGPFAGRRYSMISIMHVGNFAAALAGGGALGLVMGDRKVIGGE